MADSSFWQALAIKLESRDAAWRNSEKHWVKLATNKGAYISAVQNAKENWIRIGIGLDGVRVNELRQQALARRASIEAAVGQSMEWDGVEGRNKYQFFLKLPCDPADLSDRPRQISWIASFVPALEAELRRFT
jgi:hypothetical protein